jgi:ABC-type multidrug transport system fused ATPase/permease subunit
MTPAARVLRPYIMRHGWTLVGASACTVVLTVATLASPWPLKFVIDSLLERERPFALSGGDLALLAAVVLFILLIAAVRALAEYYSEVWLKGSGEQIVHDLRVALYDSPPAPVSVLPRHSEKGEPRYPRDR